MYVQSKKRLQVTNDISPKSNNITKRQAAMQPKM